ncbi:MAG TPA: hypothetical protein VHE23_02920 [Candidatus Acidoferrales bacterium]|nr:hypothetical protein [Candidatus Acidoferrales bacterium]
MPATHPSRSATRFVAGAALCAAFLGAPPAAAQQAPKPAPKRAEKPVPLPTGQLITPSAARDLRQHRERLLRPIAGAHRPG